MASKLDEFLKQNSIDPRRVIAASKRLEQLTDADRRLKLKKRQGKGEDAPKGGDDDEAKAPEKPRSGRAVTPVLLRKISDGKPVSGPAKQRVLRAVNRVLEQKKKDPVDLRALF